jgi:biopolymer transport protein ExbB/TolQ
MRILGVLLGSLLWIVAGVVGLLGVLLSVTVILLPIGIPLLMLARRLFQTATALVLPRKVRHPVEEMKKKTPDAVKPGRAGRKARKKAGKKTSKAAKKVGKQAGKTRDRVGRAAKKQRKKVPV